MGEMTLSDSQIEEWIAEANEIVKKSINPHSAPRIIQLAEELLNTRKAKKILESIIRKSGLEDLAIIEMVKDELMKDEK